MSNCPPSIALKIMLSGVIFDRDDEPKSEFRDIMEAIYDGTKYLGPRFYNDEKLNIYV